MKTILAAVLFCVLLFSVVAENKKSRRDENWPPPQILVMTKSLRLKCMEKTNTKLEAIMEFSEGEIHDDPNLKCYFNCILSEFRVVDDAGVVNYEKLMALLPKDLLEVGENMVKNCKDAKGDNKCEKAYNYHVCWKTNDPVHYFTI